MIDLAFISGSIRTHARAASKARSNSKAVIAGSPLTNAIPLDASNGQQVHGNHASGC
jgi:hypothetical protein